MSRTGLQIITTPIATLPLIPVSIGTPSTGDTLIFNGTTFVTTSSVGGIPTIVSIIVNTATAFAVNNTTVAVPNTTGTVVLQTGKYMYTISGTITTSAAVSAQLRLVQTAGTGTFTTVGSSLCQFMTNTTSASLFSNVTTTTILTSTANTTSQIFNGQGEINVSTSSITLQLSGFSASSTNITVLAGTLINFIKVS